MSDVGERMLAELRRIREALEGSQLLGFGKRQEPSYVFVKWDGKTVWYRRDRHEGVNRPIEARDLTGYVVNVWRFDRVDATTQEKVPRLNVQVRADKDYIVQTGFYTNFSKTFLAGLNELEPGALKEPVTLVVETNEGSRHRPTLFCRLEWRGERMTPTIEKGREPREPEFGVTSMSGTQIQHFGHSKTSETLVVHPFSRICTSLNHFGSDSPKLASLMR